MNSLLNHIYITGARFLLVREWPDEDNATKGDLIGFVHFRFTVQGMSVWNDVIILRLLHIATFRTLNRISSSFTSSLCLYSGEVIDKMAGEAQLYIYDIHIEDHSQRKGLGKHLLILLELIARREKMSYISLPVQLQDEVTKSWLAKTGRGYALDSLENIGFESAMEVSNFCVCVMFLSIDIACAVQNLLVFYAICI